MFNLKNIFASLLFLSVPAFAQTGWFSLPTPIPTSAYDVHFISQDTGFIDFISHVTMKTVDGGMSWSDYENSGKSFFPMNGLLFNIGYNGSNGYSTDRGESWQSFIVKKAEDTSIRVQNRRLEAVDFISGTLGYAINNSGYFDSNDTSIFLLKTTNMGATWIETPILTGSDKKYPLAFKFRDEMHGMLYWREFWDDIEPNGIWAEGLSFTSNGGKTWKSVSPPLQRASIYYAQNRWIIPGAYSVDDGKTWEYSICNCPSLDGELAITRDNDSIIFIVTEHHIYKSTDIGTTFVEQKSPVQLGRNGWQGIGDRINFPTTDIGYIVGYSGLTVLKTTDGGGLPLAVGVTFNELQTISPNPANSHVKFTYDELSSPTILEVFDALGISVSKELVELQTTLYRLDTRHYAPGVYFARLGSKTFRFVKQ